MKKWFVVCLLAFSVSALPLLSPAGNHSQTDNATRYARNIGAAQAVSLPVAFEPNVGQADKRVKFIGRSRGLTVFLARDAIAFALTAHTRERSNGIVELRLVGGREFLWRATDKLRGETNYFIGDDPRKWRTHIPHFARAEAANPLPGASMVAYGADDGIEYDLRLAPGVDPTALKLAISGVAGLRVDASGDLLMATGGTELRMKKPAIFEELPGAVRRRVQGEYALAANGDVGFRVGPHDSRATLVLDPSLSVAYSSFIGGTGDDSASSIALDPSGKIYVGGTTTSPGTFPETPNTVIGPGIPSNGNSSAAEFFVAKIERKSQKLLDMNRPSHGRTYSRFPYGASAVC